MHKILSQQRKLFRDKVFILKGRRLLQQQYAVATKARKNTRSSSRHRQLHTYNKNTKLCHDTTSRPQQTRQIWAKMLRDSHIALILGPKLLGLHKYKRLPKARQSVNQQQRTRVPGELRTLLYYIFLFLLFLFFFFFAD